MHDSPTNRRGPQPSAAGLASRHRVRGAARRQFRSSATFVVLAARPEFHALDARDATQ